MLSLQVFAVTLSFLDGTSFVSIGNHHQVEVFQRQDTSSIELAAVGEMNATPAEVQAVLEDYAHHPRFVPRLVESRVIEERPGERFVYQHLKLPVVHDRDYTLQVTWDNGQSRGIKFSIVSAKGPAPRPGIVRMKTMIGGWTLEPIRDGRATRATYRVEVDFAGSVPRWMVRNGAAKELPALFEGIRFETTIRRTTSKQPSAQR